MARGDNGEEGKMAGEFFEGKMAEGKWPRESGWGEIGEGKLSCSQKGHQIVLFEQFWHFLTATF
jgi:hypothetical protein